MDFIKKRILRIYPGYLVAFAFCILVVAPFALSNESFDHDKYNIKLIWQALSLRIPDVGEVFQGSHYATLNGSMWTISYEFKCYLILAALGQARILSKRGLVFGLLIILLILNFGVSSNIIILPEGSSINHYVKFLSAFFTGVTFYLYRENIKYKKEYVFIFALLLILLMFNKSLSNVSFIVLGGYILNWFAFHVNTPFISRIGKNIDLSYGVYLYSWPIQKLIILYYSNISPVMLCVITFVIVTIMAYISWVVVERPFLRLKKG